MAEGIDFVVLWVDGADSAWQAQRAQYAPGERDNGSDSNRFRDMGLLPYWFRGVEVFAPWVRKVFFVTNGQLPPWLDTTHPKLVTVRHEDYIPAQYLPTFNSNVIELWLHRIPELSERFVLFNDDMFLTAPVTPEDFFRKGLPRETPMLDIVTACDPTDCLPHMLTNNAGILNRHFRKKEVLRQQAGRFFNLRWGKGILRNYLMLPYRYFSTFRDPHLPSSYLKETFRQVWALEGELLEQTGTNRFRSKNDYTHWLMKCWQICRGDFYPRKESWGRHYELWEDDIRGICRDICRRRYRAVCINDSKTDVDFHAMSAQLRQAFETILPERCGFEKREGETE
jgi:hypothetical protein